MPTLSELQQFARYHLVRRIHDHPARDAAMGVVPLGYEPETFEREVRTYTDRFDVVERASLAYRGVERPVLEITSRNRGAKRRLLILSGVHGNEQAGIVCVPEILRRYHDARDRFADVGLSILTPVNPVGAAELSRFNADGYDINRDFVRFLTEEARLVKRTFESLRPSFVVSLHEGPQDAAFMFANEHVSSSTATRLLSALEAGGTTLATEDYFGTRLTPPGLSPSTAATRALLRLWAGTLGMMATNAYSAGLGIPELTLESSWKSPDRQARVRAHVDLSLAVCEELAQIP